MNIKDYILAAINEYNLMMYEINPIINKINGKESLIELGRHLSDYYNDVYDSENLYKEILYCESIIDVGDLKVKEYFTNVKLLIFLLKNSSIINCDLKDYYDKSYNKLASIVMNLQNINSLNVIDYVKYNFSICCYGVNKSLVNFNDAINKLRKSKKYGTHIFYLGKDIFLKYNDLKLPLFLNDLINLKNDINNFYSYLNGPNDKIPKELKIANELINEAMKNLNKNIFKKGE